MITARSITFLSSRTFPARREIAKQKCSGLRKRAGRRVFFRKLRHRYCASKGRFSFPFFSARVGECETRSSGKQISRKVPFAIASCGSWLVGCENSHVDINLLATSQTPHRSFLRSRGSSLDCNIAGISENSSNISVRPRQVQNMPGRRDAAPVECAFLIAQTVPTPSGFQESPSS